MCVLEFQEPAFKVRVRQRVFPFPLGRRDLLRLTGSLPAAPQQIDMASVEMLWGSG